MEATSQDIDCDLLVIGTGAAGSAAALKATADGLKVVLLEKTEVFGGTTVYSGGWLWVPCNPLAMAAGIVDSVDDVKTYLKAESAHRYDEERVDKYLRTVPRMVDFFEKNTHVNFFVGPVLPDYHTSKPGSVAGGRSICALPINGRELGTHLKRFRAPRRELLVFGLTIASGPDMKHFFAAGRSIVSAAYVAKRIALSLWDRALYGRDLQFGNGAALAARFFKSVIDEKITVLFSTPAQKLLVTNGRVVGAQALSSGKLVTVRARHGVVLATGGFPGSAEYRQKYFPNHPVGDQHRTLAVDTNTADGIKLGEHVGGTVDDKLMNAAPWMPVSKVPMPDGTFGTFMHLFDRGKPGVIAVDKRGLRFTNEGASYLDFVNGLFSLADPGKDIDAWLVADHRAVRRYGLGMAKPAPLSLTPFLRSGYLKRGRTIEDLAREIGVQPGALAETIRRFNVDAEQGIDSQFQRGSEAYNRYIGDVEHQPSPALGALKTGPFYAVKVIPGDIGTFAGLVTDSCARVLDADRRPIPGLYAVGADNASVFGGAYPGGGSTLGPAVTFGFIAGETAAMEAQNP